MKKKILMVYHSKKSLEEMRYAIKTHLEVLKYLPDIFEVSYYNSAEDAPSLYFTIPKIEAEYDTPEFFIDSQYDVVIFHTTFLGLRWTNFGFFEMKKRLDWLGKNGAIKIALPQDEYDHAGILDEWLFDWEVDGIMTVCGLENVKTLFPLCSKYSQFRECLTGYCTPQIQNHEWPNHAQRPYDIVYRSQKVPYWFGSHGQKKYQIADIISQAAENHKLTYNISNDIHNTVLGSKWMDFLGSGRCTIGTESGSSVIDYRGEIQAQIRYLLHKEPDITFDELNKKMPSGWDSSLITALSPRHLEAITTKTCQILLEGKYNRILIPEKHYISLKKDYSNLDDILEAIQDPEYTQCIADQAYEDILIKGKYSYKDFSDEIESLITELEQKREAREIFFDTMKRDEEDMNKKPDEMVITKELVELLQREIISLKHENARLYANLQEAQYSGVKGACRFIIGLAQQILRIKY